MRFMTMLDFIGMVLTCWKNRREIYWREFYALCAARREALG